MTTQVVIDSMMQQAKAMLPLAYAPYSKFHVGACILSESGELYSGCNIENASYSLTLCAESSAISKLICAGDKKISAVLVISDSDIICTPCGACRQRIREFSSPDTIIYCADATGVKLNKTITELLPDSFGPEHLSDLGM